MFLTIYCKLQEINFRFFAGKPGLVPVYVHKFISTKGLTQDDKSKLKEQVRNVILQPLLK